MIEFKEYMGKENNGYVNFFYNKKSMFDRVEKICTKILAENSAFSKRINSINHSIDNKSVFIQLQIQDELINPVFTEEILATKKKLNYASSDIIHIFKKYTKTFNDFMNEEVLDFKNIIIFYDNKYYKYNTNFFDSIFLSNRDIKNLINLKKLTFLYEENNQVNVLNVVGTKFDFRFKKTSIISQFVSFNNFKTEKTFKVIKKLF